MAIQQSAIRYELASWAELAGWQDGVPPATLAAYFASLGRPLAAATADDPRAFFETHFQPFRVHHDGPSGLVTGYFEPEIAGSRTRTTDFTVPLLRRPPDLVNVVPETERAAAGDGFSHLRATASGLEPYPTRRDIEAGVLDGYGLELVWLADPVDAFILHVQGSGRVVLPDGSTVRLAYAGKNGHPYTSIGRVLIERGALPENGLTLDVLAQWLRSCPDGGRSVMWHNASYVFFRELGEDELGPLGAQGVALTAGSSLAVDTAYHALGTPIFVDAPRLEVDGRPFRRLMMAQDVGSAIRGPERGDIYFGTGQGAGRVAGATKHPATFTVLLPRSPS